MTRKVLDVGQCNADHSRISDMLNQNFDVEIQRAHSHDEAIKMALDTPFDLILINRLLDADASPGMDILHSLKTNPSTSETPIMLVSNYQDSQDAAVQAGGVAGFGKEAIDTKDTKMILARYLSD